MTLFHLDINMFIPKGALVEQTLSPNDNYYNPWVNSFLLFVVSSVNANICHRCNAVLCYTPA